jgi:hypothetical protein
MGIRMSGFRNHRSAETRAHPVEKLAFDLGMIKSDQPRETWSRYD